MKCPYLEIDLFEPFLFSHSKASAANIGIIAILVHFEKTVCLISKYGHVKCPYLEIDLFEPRIFFRKKYNLSHLEISWSFVRCFIRCPMGPIDVILYTNNFCTIQEVTGAAIYICSSEVSHQTFHQVPIGGLSSDHHHSQGSWKYKCRI